MESSKTVSVNEDKRITLSKKQLLWHYSVAFFFLIVPLANVWSLVEYYFLDSYNGVLEARDLFLISLGFVFFALAFFFLQRSRLKFKTFYLSYTNEAFDRALKKTSEELKWKIIEKRKGYVRAYRDWDWSASWGELITIKRENGRILINSICNPEAVFISAVSYGWNKKNIRTFIDNLSNQSSDANVISVDNR